VNETIRVHASWNSAWGVRLYLPDGTGTPSHGPADSGACTPKAAFVTNLRVMWIPCRLTNGPMPGCPLTPYGQVMVKTNP
jgi:hypothetical protein